MTCSPARLAANRRNAQRSTGPKTARGREISRGNALKHGMTGAGVVLPEEDAAEVDASTAQLVAEMKPSGLMGRMLLRRVAVFHHRLDRCGRHDAAMAAKRVRDAEKQRDAARRAEVNDLAALLDTDPDRAVTRMMEIPEGIDGLIEAWHVLRGRLDRPGKLAWTHHDDQRLDSLLGRHPGIYPPTQFNPILRAIQGDFSGLTADQGAGLNCKKRKAWALEQLAALIDAEVEALRELRVLVDDEDEAADRAEAGDRALFDPSKEAQLARRYEAAAERGLFRALREFHEIEQRAETGAATAPAPVPAAAPPRSEPPAPRPRPAKTQSRFAPEPVSRPTPAQTNPTIGATTPIPPAPQRPAAPPSAGPRLL
ncbi:hypothetical protein TA3x_005314 [Tundrisphaera sp. TA3]|uniref:hypothetical protein n=1 Tax=Tundrisphaera sp. TA3 TaxID=3435775 RepID=UPI003EBF4012